VWVRLRLEDARQHSGVAGLWLAFAVLLGVTGALLLEP
jgi:hypothetical protein